MRLILIFLVTVLLFSLTKQNPDLTFFDERDGTSYKLALIGDSYWFSNELHYIPPNSNDSKNIVVNTSGVYYSNFISHQVCPSGWRLPTQSDWKNYFNQLKTPRQKKQKRARNLLNGLKYKNKNLNLFTASPIDLKPTGRINNEKFVYSPIADFWVNDSVKHLSHTHITSHNALIHSHSKGIFIDSLPLRLFKIRCLCEQKK